MDHDVNYTEIQKYFKPSYFADAHKDAKGSRISNFTEPCFEFKLSNSTTASRNKLLFSPETPVQRKDLVEENTETTNRSCNSLPNSVVNSKSPFEAKYKVYVVFLTYIRVALMCIF